jgi:hypothetical protein
MTVAKYAAIGYFLGNIAEHQLIIANKKATRESGFFALSKRI